MAVAFLISTRGVNTTADFADYIQYANYILDQGVMVLDINGLKAHSGPGWPLLIALNFLLAGSQSYGFILSLNVLLSASAVPVVYLMSRRVMAGKWALLVASWYLIYIPHIWQAQFLGKESLVFCLFPISIYMVLRVAQIATIDWRSLTVFILSYIYLIHSDERYFFFFPIFFLLLLLAGEGTLKQRFLKSVLVGSLLLLFMLPWTYRNYLVFDRPIVLTERTAKFTDPIFGYEAPPNPYRTSYYDLRSKEAAEYYTAVGKRIEEGSDSLNAKADPKVLRWIKQGVEEGNYPQANSYIHEKGSYLLEYWRPFRLKSNFYGSGFRYMEKWNMDRIIFSVLQYSVLLPFFLIGIFYGTKRLDRQILFFCIIIFLHSFIHVFMAHAITRYRLPIDPLIMIIAFYGMANLFLFFEKKRVRSAE